MKAARQKGLWLVILASIALVAVLSAGPAFGSGAGQAEQAAGPPVRFLVFTSGEPAVGQAVRDAVGRAGGQTVDDIRVKRGLDLLVVRVPGEAARDLAGIPGVREVSREIAPKATHDPIPWGVDRVEAECVWGGAGDCEPGVGSSRSVHVAPGTPTGAGVVVAITDSGVELNHSDLSANTSGQPHADCTQDDQECTAGGGDTDGHGTHVAGTVAATHNGDLVIGVGPGASLLSVKCLDPSTFFSCLRAVRYAAGLDSDGNVVSSPRAQVVNMSWGWDTKLQNQCPSCVATIDAIMEEAWSRGLFLATSAGNEGRCRGNGDSVGYPARLDKPMAVAATTQSDASPCFSSTGPSLDLAAPGVGILSTELEGETTTMSGTSMAAPHVSGVAALVWSANGALSNADVKAILLQTAEDLTGGDTTNTVCGGGQTHDTWHGCGLVRADLAVIEASGATPNTAPTAADISDVTNEDTPATVTLTATDPEECELTFSIVDGPSNGTLSVTENDCAAGTPNADSATVTYTPNPDFNGADSFTYQANDGTANSNTATVSITVNAVDDAPVADAGPDQSVATGSTVQLDGTGSSDVDGDTLTYSWSLSVPAGSSATLDSTTIVNPTFVADIDGSYLATLVVNDGTTDSPPDSATITAATPSGSADSMHVGGLDGASYKTTKGRWGAQVTITAHKADDTLLTGSTVTGRFAQNGWTKAVTCTDGGAGDLDGAVNGQCTVDSGEFPSNSGNAIFTVDDVTHPDASLSYDPNDNHDPDGDSDGTTIQLSK